MAKQPLSEKEKVFVREYLACLNASEAYRKAYNYKGKNADVLSARLMVKAGVAAAIAAKQAVVLEKLDMKADDVVERYTRIALADPGELTQHRIGSCRFCHGIDHEYQWKTPREFRKALIKAELALPKKPTKKQRDDLPTDEGGFGYDLTRAPNPRCPECNGLGVPYVTFADTTKLSDAGRLLFEAVEQTNTGLKLKITDRSKALEAVAKHLGVLKDKVEHDVSDPLKDLIKAVQGTPLLPGSAKAPPPAPSGDPASSQGSIVPGSASERP